MKNYIKKTDETGNILQKLYPADAITKDAEAYKTQNKVPNAKYC